MSQDINALVERCIATADPLLTRNERRDLIQVLETDYPPYNIERLILLATLISQRQTRLAVEYVERDIHEMMKRYWGDKSPQSSYENGI